MNFCKLSAIIQPDRIDFVEKKLTEIGIAGFTKMNVIGFGEYRNNYSKEGTSSHVRVEIYLQESRAQDVVEEIMEVAHTGVEGDGIIVISPVDEIYRIRTREKCHAEESC